ncbi:MAG TPA: TIGR03960 family B12-binding radical SAM protein [Candidatus Limiplasma sp.]|nr:TIGR03960 family B12-binding radical SAM protein [Candidatus Limiplasma sp.]HPS81777.1 TIGR03960 family B12-binding radical SAM protein [Candidatus Limiplasma sp.]
MISQIEKLLERVEKPARYTGNEMNTDVKPIGDAEISFAFCFPDTYEVAMSHLGMKILYHIINALPYAVCERVCMPWSDMLEAMKAEGVPLFSLESRTALNRFDIVGFTLQYEMSYTNILEMLSVGGVPVKAAERGDADPIVVAGGPCASNPEPLHAFIDAFMMGDGEEVIVEVVDLLNDCKKKALPRAERLRLLAGIEGVYVPSLYRAAYNADGTLQSFEPTDPAAPVTVKKRFVRDMDTAAFPDTIPVPYTQIVHDRIMLEIMRGCTRGCRFCQAGMLYRPVRERSLEKLMEMAEKLVGSTGYEEISLSSLSSGDYSCLSALCEQLMEKLSPKRVSISLPSLRIDSVVKDSLAQTQKVKKTSLTFAPEAGTQRLRDVINKGVTQADLLAKLKDAFEGGWNSVKLYFMMGLPTETKEDLEGIAQLAKEAVQTYYSVPKGQRAKGLRVTCSASVFVPKPFTPFQWCAQDTMEAVKRKQMELRGLLSAVRGVTFHWHEPSVSFMEACFAVGDRRMADVLYRAWELGCKLDGWNEHFHFSLWLQAFADCGIDPAFYANRKRDLEELLPWDFIDIGVTKRYLKLEYARALEAQTTRDCRLGCNGCGIERIKGLCKLCE